MEILDKIELFAKKPETVEIWASGDERKIWKKLSPPRVRELLGRNNLDHIYRYFSEEGSHATFTAMRPRLREQSDVRQTAEFAIMIGGLKDSSRQMSVLIYCIQLGQQAILMTQRAFADRLQDLDITNMVTQLTADTNTFHGHFLDALDRFLGNMEPLKIHIAVLQRMRDRGEI